MQSLWDMEKFSVDWDHRPQIFQIRTKYWDFSEMREVDRTFNFSNYSLMPFFLLLSKFTSSAALSAVGGDIWTRLLYYHFFQSQLIIRTVSNIKFLKSCHFFINNFRLLLNSVLANPILFNHFGQEKLPNIFNFAVALLFS